MLNLRRFWRDAIDNCNNEMEEEENQRVNDTKMCLWHMVYLTSNALSSAFESRMSSI